MFFHKRECFVGVAVFRRRLLSPCKPVAGWTCLLAIAWRTAVHRDVTAECVRVETLTSPNEDHQLSSSIVSLTMVLK